MENKDIICWWSGGVTSAVACKKAIEMYGKDRCRVIMLDTCNEDEDTYRFRTDCSFWYNVNIETISVLSANGKYKTIQDVWYDYESLNVATGAICSTVLKRELRIKWQKENSYTYQIFGFEFTKKEFNRAMSMKDNYKDSKPIFPLLMMGLDKSDCIKILTGDGIKIPNSYLYGFHNNNCLKTGCVQGGIGYWQKMKKDFPEKFNQMDKVEKELTELKGKPVTMLKDQSNAAKDSGIKLVFLSPNENYPEYKSLSDFPIMEVKPLEECNGFCNTNMYNPKNQTQFEINFENI